jgi:hypothetical protein
MPAWHTIQERNTEKKTCLKNNPKNPSAEPYHRKDKNVARYLCLVLTGQSLPKKTRNGCCSSLTIRKTPKVTLLNCKPQDSWYKNVLNLYMLAFYSISSHLQTLAYLSAKYCNRQNSVIVALTIFLPKAISCFFSVLRQFKIMRPIRQPSEKTNML